MTRFHTVVQKAAGRAVQFKGEENWKEVRDLVGSGNFHSYDPIRQLVLIGPEGKDRAAPSDWVVSETTRATGVTTFYVVRDVDFKHEFEITGERDLAKEDEEERNRVSALDRDAAQKDAIEHRTELPSTAGPEPGTDRVSGTPVPPAGSTEPAPHSSPGMKEVLSRETSQPRFAPTGRPGMGESAAPNATTLSPAPGPGPTTPPPSPGAKAVGIPGATAGSNPPLVTTTPNVPGSGAPKK